MASRLRGVGKGRKGGRDPTVEAIERIQRAREARRHEASSFSRDRAEEERRLAKEGRPGDVDFQRLIEQFRAANAGKSRKVRPPVRAPV